MIMKRTREIEDKERKGYKRIFNYFIGRMSGIH